MTSLPPPRTSRTRSRPSVSTSRNSMSERSVKEPSETNSILQITQDSIYMHRVSETNTGSNTQKLVLTSKKKCMKKKKPRN